MLELEFEETEERRSVLKELDEIEAKVVRLAESLSDKGAHHRVRNVAQSVASQKSLLIQDWHFEDKEKADSEQAA